MKNIKYLFPMGEDEHQVLVEKVLGSETEEAFEASLEVAKKEAYNGEYIIEDDGQPDPMAEPTQLDRIEAQIAYTAMMTDTLLGG
jgi:hypothetical protein